MARTTAAKPKSKKNGVKCTFAGCRRKPIPGGVFCSNHANRPVEPTPETAPGEFPIDHVQKITELEGLRFSALDTELRNHAQGIQLLDQEMQLADINHQRQQQERKLKKASLEVQINAKKREYLNLVEGLAQKYGVPADKMSIDPETLTIRDLRDEKAS